MFELSPEQIFLFALSGVVVSLVLEYFPKLSDWYNALADNIQRLIVLASGFVVILSAFGLACLDILGTPWTCSAPGLYDALLAYVAFLVASQTAFLISLKRNRS